MVRFPQYIDDGKEDDVDNAAVQVFGRRFFKDQTPVEYLAEFFLVFASAKDVQQADEYEFPDYAGVVPLRLSYHPRYRLGLKLFAFLGASKLETRHRIHITSFRSGVAEVERRISPDSSISTQEGVRLIQGLFSGFVGVAGDRTWTAHTFLPASGSLLAGEVLWRHAGTRGAAKKDLIWDEAWDYFETGKHSFMARGGELLYLQLASMFNTEGRTIPSAFRNNVNGTYTHFDEIDSTDQLRANLQQLLKALLQESDHAVGAISDFVQNAFDAAGVDSEYPNPRTATLGWVPRETATEAFLFAWEAENICKAQRSGLQKISLLKDLCVLQVMRSLCFQSARVMELDSLKGFVGGYSWVACAVDATTLDPGKKIAINAYDAVENLLYRSLRNFGGYSPDSVPSDETKKQSWLDKGDDNTIRLFRKIGKQIGVIVPRKGQGMRINLPSHIVRLLVAALVPPGKRIRLDAFYQRIFGHYGIAINRESAESALSPYGIQLASDAFGLDSTWFEEELRRGGYLIPLSDAVSLVCNPYKG
jgi:hypothetical protein